MCNVGIIIPYIHVIKYEGPKKMWVLGFTFLSVSALVYLLIMIFWLNIIISISTINWIRVLIGIVAISGGCYNLYKCYKNRKMMAVLSLIERNVRRCLKELG